MYKYRALVIDDEVQIDQNCTIYKKYLKLNYNIDIDFDVINRENEYNENKPYDILLVDYDLKKGFCSDNKFMGDLFIKKFRENNKISKVIFYSSAFRYDTKKYDFPFSDKDTFDLINNLQIDRIADKNNFYMMIEVIKSCCEKIDVLPVLLSRLISEYGEEDIKITYTNKDGTDIPLSEILNDILQDNDQGKKFREQIIDTVLSVILKFHY